MLRLINEDELPGPPAVPHERECVVCFVDRMTHAYGCSDRLLWAQLWRDRRAPRATALERRLEQHGGFCDCEVLMNSFVRRELADARIRGTWTDEDQAVEDDLERQPPDCLGVRPGSARACGRWRARRRGTW